MKVAKEFMSFGFTILVTALAGLPVYAAPQEHGSPPPKTNEEAGRFPSVEVEHTFCPPGESNVATCSKRRTLGRRGPRRLMVETSGRFKMFAISSVPKTVGCTPPLRSPRLCFVLKMKAIPGTSLLVLRRRERLPWRSWTAARSLLGFVEAKMIRLASFAAPTVSKLSPRLYLTTICRVRTRLACLI